jgi:hypothetical protein
MDPDSDPGGPKSCGSGSPTLNLQVYNSEIGQTLTTSERRRQTTAERIWAAGRYFLGSRVRGVLTTSMVRMEISSSCQSEQHQTQKKQFPLLFLLTCQGKECGNWRWGGNWRWDAKGTCIPIMTPYLYQPFPKQNGF